MGDNLHHLKLDLIAQTWAGFDLLSYSAGLLTAAPVLILAALIAHLTDKPDHEPADTAGRVELLTIHDSDPDGV